MYFNRRTQPPVPHHTFPAHKSFITLFFFVFFYIFNNFSCLGFLYFQITIIWTCFIDLDTLVISYDVKPVLTVHQSWATPNSRALKFYIVDSYYQWAHVLIWSTPDATLQL